MVGFALWRRGGRWRKGGGTHVDHRRARGRLTLLRRAPSPLRSFRAAVLVPHPHLRTQKGGDWGSAFSQKDEWGRGAFVSRTTRQCNRMFVCKTRHPPARVSARTATRECATRTPEAKDTRCWFTAARRRVRATPPPRFPASPSTPHLAREDERHSSGGLLFPREQFRLRLIGPHAGERWCCVVPRCT